MKRQPLLLAALVSLSMPGLFANPLAVDGQQRPVTMTGEKVTIEVGKNDSLVKGVYTFRQEKDDWPEERDTHVTIYVPVPVPTKRVDAYKRQYGSPILTVGKRQIEEWRWNDISLANAPNSDGVVLPKGWSVAFYRYEIPLNILGKNFSVGVSYTQMNLPGDVSAYVPFNPPKESGSALITFRAEPGFALKPYNGRSLSKSASSTVKVVPEHKVLIRAKCVKLKQ